MLTDSELKELLSYQSQSPVLSVYLNTDPAQGNADAYKLRLRTMLKEVDQRNADVVLGYIDHEFDWSGRSVAIYSCATEDFFRAYSLAIPVRDRVRVSHQPHVKPLADLLDTYGGYAVAIIDKQGARLFYFHMGELREQEGMMGEAIRRTKRGGASQFPGRRGGVAGQTNYAEEVADRNMKEAVEFATQFFTEHHVRRIILGGTDDNLALFRSHLPKTWQSLVVGTLPMSMTTSHAEVFERVMEIIRAEDYRREVDLVKTVITAASKKQQGTLGLEDTLRAVREGRVMTLLVNDGFRSKGYLCQDCGHLAIRATDACEFCGGQFVEIPDVVDLVVTEVMKAGGEVEIVRDIPELVNAGQIGALLRY
jgi:peptide chain release factor subunit 1